MRLLFSLVLATIAGVSASFEQAPHVSVSNAFYPAHSHSMLIHPSTLNPSRSVRVSISAPTLSPSTSAHALNEPVSIVADTQRRILGLLPLQQHSPLPITPSLTLPHASIQLSIESGSTSSQLAHTLSSNAATHMTLHDVSYGADDVALATTLSTGKQPVDTGIIARQWSDTEPMTAFSTAASSSHMATVADVVSQSFDGQSLILSISADPVMSMTNCLHPTLATKNYARWNFFCVALDDKSFAPRHFSSPSQIAMTHVKSELSQRLTVSRTDLLQQLTSSGSNVLSALPSTMTVSYTTDAIIIDGVSFSTSSLVDMSLLLELQYISNVISVLQEHELVNDGIPDHIAINVASLKTIRTHYGVASPQFAVAQKLIQYCVPSLLSNLSDIYDDSIIRTLILLGDEPVDMKLSQYMTTHVKQQLSLSYLPFLSSHDSSTCAMIDSIMRPMGYQVYCPTMHALYQRMYTYAVGNASNTTNITGGCNATSGTNCTVYTAYQVQKYQILLWFSILLVLVLLSAIFSLCCMQFKKDTMLYSSFNPNWEDRKRR